MNIKVSNPNLLKTIDYRLLKPLQGNLKDLNEKNYNKLKNVLIKRGFTTPFFVWHDQEYWLIDGHQRQRVMIQEDMNHAGSYEMPYIEIKAKDRKDAKAQLLEISSQYGHITYEGFDEFTDELDNEDFELVAFDALSFLDADDEEETEEDEAPEVSSDPPVSKLGEIYQLGRHFVMCGDSTDFGAVSDLMDGQRAKMCFTDPPYNVDYGSNQSPIWGKSRTIMNDKMTDEEWIVFIDAFNSVILEFVDGGIYIAMSCKELDRVKASFEKNGGHWSSYIIWVKQQLVPGRKDYQSKYEPILYGWKEGVKDRYFTESRKEVDVWEHDRPNVSKEHPTMKPISLMAEAIGNSSKSGDIVLDLFLGSGSTLIACEQTDRICYGMELNPKYVDVIRKRYWKFVNGSDEGWAENTQAVNIEQETTPEMIRNCLGNL